MSLDFSLVLGFKMVEGGNSVQVGVKHTSVCSV